MMSKHRFRDWDDEDYRPSQKKHGKGHQSKHGKNDFLAFGDAEDEYVAPTPIPPQKTPQKGSQAALRPQEPRPRPAEQKQLADAVERLQSIVHEMQTVNERNRELIQHKKILGLFALLLKAILNL